MLIWDAIDGIQEAVCWIQVFWGYRFLATSAFLMGERCLAACLWSLR
jgi:hypothetical protein